MIDEETGKSKVVEKVGLNVVIYYLYVVYVMEVNLRVKTYKNGLYEHSTGLIEKVYDEGIVLTKEERNTI